MKAIALVVSARKHGNCFDFAQFVLDDYKNRGLETELINFYDHHIPARAVSMNVFKNWILPKVQTHFAPSRTMCA